MMTKNSPFIMVIEGPRGAGKSTVANAVVARLGEHGYKAEYFKKGVPVIGPGEFQNMKDHLVLFSTKKVDFVLVDRFQITEWVMSIALARRNDVMTLMDDCLKIHRMVATHGETVLLTAELETLDKRMAERGTRTWDLEPAVSVAMWRAASSVFPSVHLDTTYMAFPAVVSGITNLAISARNLKGVA